MILTLEQIDNDIISPAMGYLPLNWDNARARVMLVAIGLQESGFKHRYQVIDANDPSRKGPARGFWQFERTGGVRGLMRSQRTSGLIYRLLEDRKVPWDETLVWEALEFDDILAAAFARMLLWSDPSTLPLTTATNEAWDIYINAWRPGKPHKDKWAANHKQARKFYNLQNPSRVVKLK